MEKITNALNEIHDMNDVYSLSNEGVDNSLNEIANAKVCTPIIGKFSSGKSALVNTLLGYSRRVLKEDITPETAVPTEIVYAELEDSVTLYHNNGTQKDIEVLEYRTMELDGNSIRCARLNLRNRCLEEIPDVMLVDMPGFESGFEIHNKVIDNYLPQSLAYIIAFPADDMIVRSSVGNILKELCLYDMPLCVVITKYDKKNDDFDVSFEKMKEMLKRYVGEKPIKYCLTSSFTGDADELKAFLVEIQRRSKDLLANRYRKSVLSHLASTENYLITTLKNNQMSESELDVEEEKLGKQLTGINDKISKERGDFNIQIPESVNEILMDVQTALDAEEATLIAMAMNNQNINDHINSVIRNSVTISINKRFIPKVEKYLKRVSNCIGGESINDVHVNLNIDTEGIKKEITPYIVAVVAATLIGFPILSYIIALINKIAGDKKREEIKNQIRMKLRLEIYPQIKMEVGNSIKTAITKQIELINTSIDDEIKIQRETLEKAMADLRGRMNDEQVKKENLAADVKTDLERIGEIRNGI